MTVLASRRGYSSPHPLYLKKENLDGVKIIRVWPFLFDRSNPYTRMLDAFLILTNFFLKTLCLPRFDKIVVLTSPPLAALFVGFVAKIKGTPVIQWLMDLNPDQAVEADWIRRGSIAEKFLEGALRTVLKNTEMIVVLDRFMRDRMIAKGIAAEKIHVVPPWSLDEDVEDVKHDRNPFRRKHHLDGKFVVMYAGNHSICHPLDTLLEAANELKSDPEIMFLFIGGGERVRDVLEFKEKNQLTNIVFLPYVERSEIKYSLSAADLHVVVMGDPYVGIVHPCKIYSVLTIGRPFVYIGPGISHVTEIMSQGGFGFQVKHGDTEGLVKTIQTVKEKRPNSSGAIVDAEKKMAETYSKERLMTEMSCLILKKAKA